MLLSSSGRDAASQAALRVLMERLPGVSATFGPASFEPPVSADPPTLEAVNLVEGESWRAYPVGSLGPSEASGFAAFLDGAQKVQVMGDHAGIPVVFGTASAAIRVRVNRRMVTWGQVPPRVERKLFLPFRYLPSLDDVIAHLRPSRIEIRDTGLPDRSGHYPSLHPTALLERALNAVGDMREQLEHEFAEAWCATAKAPLFIDGGIGGSKLIASSTNAIGIVKSHRRLFAEGDTLRTVFALGHGQRSPVFEISPRLRTPVWSWYLRVRDPKGHDAMWGLVRVEACKGDRPTERADEISRWVMAEMSPLSLPDGRWDKMAYGVRDCEEFLRAIS